MKRTLFSNLIPSLLSLTFLCVPLAMQVEAQPLHKQNPTSATTTIPNLHQQYSLSFSLEDSDLKKCYQMIRDKEFDQAQSLLSLVQKDTYAPAEVVGRAYLLSGWGQIQQYHQISDPKKQKELLEKALSSLDQALQFDPQNPSPYLLKADLLLSQGNRIQALDQLEQAFVKDPTLVQCLATMESLAYQQADWKKLAKYSQQHLAIWPASKQAYYYHTQALLQQKQWAKLEKAIEAHLNANRGDYWIHQYSCELLADAYQAEPSEEKLKRLKDHLVKMESLDKNNPLNYLLRAKVHQLEGEEEQALSQLNSSTLAERPQPPRFEQEVSLLKENLLQKSHLGWWRAIYLPISLLALFLSGLLSYKLYKTISAHRSLSQFLGGLQASSLNTQPLNSMKGWLTQKQGLTELEFFHLTPDQVWQAEDQSHTFAENLDEKSIAWLKKNQRKIFSLQELSKKSEFKRTHASLLSYMKHRNLTYWLHIGHINSRGELQHWSGFLFNRESHLPLKSHEKQLLLRGCESISHNNILIKKDQQPLSTRASGQYTQAPPPPTPEAPPSPPETGEEPQFISSALFGSELQRAMGEASTEQTPLSLIVLGVDKLGELGQRQDKVQQVEALIFENIQSHQSQAAIFKSGEIAIILEQADLTTSLSLAEKLRSQSENRFHDWSGTLSLGVAVYPISVSNDDCEKLLDASIHAFHQASKDGNAVYCAPQSSEKLAQKE